MQPTFNPGHASAPLHHDVVLLDRWSVALNLYRRGDVVTLWSPQNPKLLTTKRIIALEGDLVCHRLVFLLPRIIEFQADNDDFLSRSRSGLVAGPSSSTFRTDTHPDPSRSLLGRRRLALPFPG